MTTIKTPEEKLFKHYFNEHVDFYRQLKNDAGRKKLSARANHQWVLDSLDHLQRALTKDNVSQEDKEFCSNVVLKMFKVPGLKEEVFDDVEAILGSEHFVRDLMTCNKDLKKLVQRL